MSKRKASIETSNIWDKLRAEKEEEGFDGKEIEAYIQSYADTLMATAPPIVLPQLGSTRLRLDLGSASAQLKTPFSQVEAGSCGLRLGSGLKPAQAGQLQLLYNNDETVHIEILYINYKILEHSRSTFSTC
jgi:hypothetical protein